MKVFWTDTAVQHLSAIHQFISTDSPTYAQRVVDRLISRSEQVAKHPLSGRMVPEAGYKQIREVVEGSYRIIYHIKPEQIDVIAVIHGAQQTPWSSASADDDSDE